MTQLTIGGKTARSTLGQHVVEVDFDGLPDTSKAFIVAYGLRQYLADAMAGAENEADAKAKIEARRAKLVSGDLTRTRGEGKDAPDSVESRALKLIRAAIRGLMKAKNQKADKETINAAASKVLADEAKGATWRAKAKEQLEQEAAMSDGLDLGDLIPVEEDAD